MDDDPLLMSLADALTCAFGASVALFLIFVVLARFEPPAPIPTSGAQASRSITASLAQDEPGSSSLVILAQSTLKHTTSCTGSAVFSLEVTDTDPEGVRDWTAETAIWDRATQTGVLCRRVFEIPAGVTAPSQPTLRVTRGTRERVGMRVHVGANAWPAWDAFWEEDVSPIDGNDQPPILRVTGALDKPVLTRNDL